MKDTFIQWKGFEFQPTGCLLEQVIDEAPGMGLAYERSCNFYKQFHTHDRLIIIFPRNSCEMEVRTKNPNQTFSIDSSNFLTVPSGVVHDDEGISAIYDTVALLPNAKLINEVARADGLSASASELNSKCRKLKRSPWLEQLIQQYFFERVIAKNKKTADIDFIERKILSEILAAIGGKKNIETEMITSEQDSISKAITYIETNLFSKLETNIIAKNIGVGVATLFRQFKKEIGVSPYVYIKRRRLEEAMRLLRTGRYSVSEVALLVGYENFGAFTDAFKARYKKLPSAVK